MITEGVIELGVLVILAAFIVGIWSQWYYCAHNKDYAHRQLKRAEAFEAYKKALEKHP
jgi:hypothetical protein